MKTKCLICDEWFTDITYHRHYDLHKELEDKRNKEHKMTRSEALKACFNSLNSKKIEAGDIVVNQLIGCLEALGLLKFEEEKKIKVVFEFKDNNFGMGEYLMKYGVIRLEEWPEGLVLWVDGKAVWKSWHEYSDITNPVRK